LLKRLLQNIRVPVISIKALGAIAREKHKGPAVVPQGIGDGIAPGAMKIEIENGEIGLPRRQSFESPVYGGCNLDAFATDVEKRVLDQHGDNGFVLDDENMEILDCFHGALSLAGKGKLDHKHPIGDVGSKASRQTLH
jgi:hypothetical protein